MREYCVVPEKLAVSDTNVTETPTMLDGTTPSNDVPSYMTGQPCLNSPFLRLPPELRNKIYHLTLLQPTIQVLPGLISDFASTPIQPHGRHLVYTCRQLYLEASPVYFGLNTFAFDTLFHFRRFGVTRRICSAVRFIQLVYNSLEQLMEMMEYHRLRFGDLCPFGELKTIYVLGAPGWQDESIDTEKMRELTGNKVLEVVFRNAEE